MSKLLLICGTLTLTAGTSLLAQSRPATRTPPEAEKPVAGVVASIVLTGCLERWSDAAMKTGAAADTAPAGAEFVLTTVDGNITPPAGAAGREKTAPKARYLLLSSPTMNYAQHVNHIVKVVGSIAPQPAEGASVADRIAEPGRAETNLPAGPTSEAYRLNLVEVASLTMVAKTCGK
ncbi:MAG: hypothetical protein ABI880_05135 [Acidobacteriota bacterium]